MVQDHLGRRSDPWLKGEVKTLLDRVGHKIIDRHPDCQASRRLFAQLDPDRPTLGAELLAA